MTSFSQVDLGVYLDMSANKLNFSQHHHLHIHGLAMSMTGFFYCSPYEKMKSGEKRTLEITSSFVSIPKRFCDIGNVKGEMAPGKRS